MFCNVSRIRNLFSSAIVVGRDGTGQSLQLHCQGIQLGGISRLSRHESMRVGCGGGGGEALCWVLGALVLGVWLL